MRVLVPAMFLLSASAAAQRTVPATIDRGAHVIGGAASLARSTVELDLPSGVPAGTARSTTTSLIVNPTILRFVAPRLAIGGTLTLARFDGEGAETTAWGLGPAARWYVGGDAKVLPFVGVSATFGRSASTLANGVEQDGSTNGFDAAAGLTWLFSPHVGLTTEGFFNRESTSSDSAQPGLSADQTRTSYGLRLGIATFLTPRR